jgi:hypothetical protein
MVTQREMRPASWAAAEHASAKYVSIAAPPTQNALSGSESFLIFESTAENINLGDPNPDNP